MRGPAKAMTIGALLACWLVPRPVIAAAPSASGSRPEGEAPTLPAEPSDPLGGDPVEAPAPDPQPAPEEPSPEAQVPEPAPTAEPAPAPEPTPAVPEPAPEPPTEPTAEAAPTTGAEPFPATEDAGPARSKRALGLGLLVAGSGFVVIGATTAGLYAGTEKRCGGSCIGGAIAAAAGVAGVVVGAIVFTRAGRRDVALHSGARTVARWRPGRGVSF